MKRSSDNDDTKDRNNKRPRGPGERQPQEPMPCTLKYLASEALAAAIIGKGGNVIADMRAKTGARISLTDHGEFFPGTDSRIVIAQATSEAALGDLSNMIIAKLSETAEATPHESLGTPEDLKLNVLVPKGAVGGIIGKGGSNVKQLRENSEGKISIGDPVGHGNTAEQVVALGGSQHALEYIIAEVNKQVQALGGEHWFEQWAAHKTIGAAGSGGGRGGGRGDGGRSDARGDGGYSTGYSGGGGGRHSGSGYSGASSGGGLGAGVDLMMQVAKGLPSYVMEDTRGFALTCVVPNRLVGGIIGRGGTGTKEVQQLTGTKIGIREIPGDADNRSLNIAGPLSNACSAYMLMMKRYLDSEAEAAQRGNT